MHEGLEPLQTSAPASLPGPSSAADTRQDRISPPVMKAAGDRPGRELGALNPKAAHRTFSSVTALHPETGLPASSLTGRAVIQIRGCDVVQYRNLEPEWTLETVTDKGSILQKRKPNLTGFRMKGCGPQREKPRNENVSPALERSPGSAARGEPVQQLGRTAPEGRANKNQRRAGGR